MTFKKLLSHHFAHRCFLKGFGWAKTFSLYSQSKEIKSHMKSLWQSLCVSNNHTHTQKKTPTVSVMSFSWHTSIHPSPAPLSPSLRPSSRAAQIHLCDWLPSISSSSHENKSQLGLKRFRKEANDLIKTLNREARMKLINYRQRGTFLTFYIYI